MNATILGVSLDDLETQKRFKAELNLPYELLSDSEKKVSKSFGVLNPKGTYSQRKTFIISPDGKIAHIFHEVDVNRHGEEVKEVLERLQ
jgi:thioredoxin-dependent peroxiredoxin